MSAKDPVTGIANAITGFTKALMAWMSSKRMRYSLKANEVAYLYIKRTKKIHGDEDKQLRKYERKFMKLTVSQ